MESREGIKLIKDKLYQYGILLAEEKELNLRLRELEESYGVKEISYNAIGSRNGISKITERMVEKKLEAEGRLQVFKKSKGIEIERMENALTVLNEKEFEFIELKYIKRRRIDSIPYLLDRSKRTCERIESSSLKKIDAIINLEF